MIGGSWIRSSLIIAYHPWIQISYPVATLFGRYGMVYLPTKLGDL